MLRVQLVRVGRRANRRRYKGVLTRAHRQHHHARRHRHGLVRVADQVHSGLVLFQVVSARQDAIDAVQKRIAQVKGGVTTVADALIVAFLRSDDAQDAVF